MATPPPAATGQPDTLGNIQDKDRSVSIGCTWGAQTTSLPVCGVPQCPAWWFVECPTNFVAGCLLCAICTQLGCISASMPNLAPHDAQPDCVLGCYVSVCLYAVCHITACLCHHSLCVCGVPHQPHIRLSVWVAGNKACL
jgi:hypothetical protein